MAFYLRARHRCPRRNTAAYGGLQAAAGTLGQRLNSGTFEAGNSPDLFQVEFTQADHGPVAAISIHDPSDYAADVPPQPIDAALALHGSIDINAAWRPGAGCSNVVSIGTAGTSS